MSRRRKISLVTAALLLLLGGAAWWLVGSEGGLRFLWARAVAWSPVPLSGEVHGRLLGPLRAEGLRVELRSASVEVGAADLDWAPWGLLQGRLMFSRADVRQVVVTIKPRGAGGGTPRVPSPPLPVDVRGTVEGLVLRIGGDVPREFRFERVGVEAVAGPADLVVRTFTLDGYGLHLEADGEAALRPDGAVKASTRWSWQLPQGERLRGHGTVTGTLARPRTDQSLDAGVEGTARASLVWLDQPLRWQAEVIARPVDIARLDRRAHPVVVGGQLRAEGGGGQLQLVADGRLKEAKLGSWNFHGEGARLPGGWRLPAVKLSAAEGPATVSASGLLYTTGSAAVALDLEWDGFSAPANAIASAPAGKITVNGSLHGYHVAGRARLARAGLPDGEVDLEGNGDRHAFQVTTLRAAWLEGEVTGSGRVQWQPFLGWEAELRARDLNPGRWRAEYPGRIAAQFASRGERRHGALQAELTLDRVTGTLRGNPLSGSGRFRWEKGALLIDSFDLVNGTAAFSAQGELGSRWDMRAELVAEKVEDLVPGISGRVAGEVRVSGPRAQPWVRAEATGSDLAWQERRAARLAVKASIDLLGAHPWDARVTGEGIRVAGLLFDRVELSGQGDPSDHRLTLDAGVEGRTLHLEAKGAYGARRWGGELSAGRLDDPQLGRWVQAAPVAFAVDPRNISLGQGCWSHEGASLCVGLAGGVGKEWSGEAELHAFPVAALQPFMRPGFEVNGLIDGHAGFRFREGLTALDLKLAATGGDFRFLLTGADAITTPYRRIDLQLRAGRLGFEGESSVVLANGDHARARFSLPRWRPGSDFSPGQPLRGALEADLRELVWVSLLVPDVVADGRLTGRFAVAGTLGHPSLDGEATLGGGRLAIPLLGLSLTQLRFGIRTDGPEAMNLSASARSGPGQITIAGRATATAEGWSLAAKVTGERVEVARLPQAYILASPNLDVAVRDRTIRLQGSVLIPEARIDLPELTAPVQSSGDVVVVDRPGGQERRRPWTIVSEITLRFGENVKLSGYGFSGRLAGELVVVEPEGGGALGRGELRIVDGKYTSYGQDLTIEEGRLLYGNAPLNNPGIQFRAVREIEDVKVGVLATGRLKKPEIRLYSEPAMDDTDVLSWMVLGRPLASVTQDENATLQRAAVSLGLVGGAELARRIGDEAGLDVVNVQPVQTTTTASTVQAPGAGSATGTGTNGATNGTSPYQASLVLGKYLSPRLYVQYAVGLWDTGNAWQMRYLLDKNWSVKAETGLQSGVDLLYTIEK